MQVTKRGWFHRLEPGHVSGRQLKNRVNLTVAISTRGRCAYSLHHEKNNTPAVILFFKFLFDVLKKDDADYVNNSIFMMDCAPIQRSDLFLRWAGSRKEKFAFLSKYSWPLAPVEKVFS